MTYCYGEATRRSARRLHRTKKSSRGGDFDHCREIDHLLQKLVTKLFPMLALVAFAARDAKAAQSKSANETLRSFIAARGFAGAPIVRRPTNDLFVRITINGTPGSILVATSCEITGIDRNRASKFGLVEVKTNKKAHGSFGPSSERVGMSAVKALGIGNCIISNVPVAILNLSSLQFDGVFGTAEMRKFGVVIDCGGRMLYISPRGRNGATSATLAQLLDKEGYTRIPMSVSAGRDIVVSGHVNDRPISLRVNTGSFLTCISPATAAMAGVTPIPTGITAGAYGGRTARLSAARLGEFRVGAFRMSNVGVAVAGVTGNEFGSDYLLSNSAVIDLGGMNLFLRSPQKR